LDRDYLYPAEGLERGGYILAGNKETQPDIILIASGSEVSVALAVHNRLMDEGTRSRVVSLPSWELFAAQDQDYRDSVLPAAVRARISIEAGITMGWKAFVGEDGVTLGIDRFGASAPGGLVMEKLGISIDNLYQSARTLLEG
jgi:transketolase